MKSLLTGLAGRTMPHLAVALLAFGPAATGAEKDSDVIRADNPVTCYRLEEATGAATAADSSATDARHGSERRGAVLSRQAVTGCARRNPNTRSAA